MNSRKFSLMIPGLRFYCIPISHLRCISDELLFSSALCVNVDVCNDSFCTEISFK